MQKVFLTLQASDYSNGKYSVTLPEVIENPRTLSLENFSVTTPNDSEVVHSSDAISQNKRDRSAQTNQSIGDVVYCLYPELRVPRAYTQTVPGSY